MNIFETNEKTFDNIIIENPNHRLTILAIKQINFSTRILGECVDISVGKCGWYLRTVEFGSNSLTSI
jgi:hypothetical protein